MATNRHWKEKAHAALLGILNAQRQLMAEGLPMMAPKKPLTRSQRTRVLEHSIQAINYALWPFYDASVLPPPMINDTEARLAKKFAQLGYRIRESTNEYITPIHLGQLFPGSRLLGECPVTIEAEQGFCKHLNALAQSYIESRSSRRPAVLRKISHAVIAWWGIVYGAWQGTSNQFSIETLSWEETSDLFNCFCLADCKEHKSEQIRKLISRLLKEVKRTYPICAKCSMPMVFPHY
jgi:hypothetical protein